MCKENGKLPNGIQFSDSQPEVILLPHAWGAFVNVQEHFWLS